jgi:hypothetical protein
MRATLKALELCLAEEATCVEKISKLAADNNQGGAFPAEQQARTWSVESSWVRASAFGAPGVQTEEEWQNEYEMVQAYGGLENPPPLADMMDTDLVASLYADGKLLWPGN